MIPKRTAVEAYVQPWTRGVLASLVRVGTVLVFEMEAQPMHVLENLGVCRIHYDGALTAPAEWLWEQKGCHGWLP